MVPGQRIEGLQKPLDTLVSAHVAEEKVDELIVLQSQLVTRHLTGHRVGIGVDIVAVGSREHAFGPVEMLLHALPRILAVYDERVRPSGKVQPYDPVQVQMGTLMRVEIVHRPHHPVTQRLCPRQRTHESRALLRGLLEILRHIVVPGVVDVEQIDLATILLHPLLRQLGPVPGHQLHTQLRHLPGQQPAVRVVLRQRQARQTPVERTFHCRLFPVSMIGTDLLSSRRQSGRSNPAEGRQAPSPVCLRDL